MNGSDPNEKHSGQIRNSGLHFEGSNDMTQQSITEAFGEFIEGFSAADLTADQTQKIKWFFLDWLASAIAGGEEKPVRIILKLIAGMGGTCEASVIANRTRSASLWAAMANGAASHVVEMDDLHRESILHPAAAIIPAVFAAAESRNASGNQLIAGIAAGYEIGIRVALAAGPEHYRCWHTTATCGTFGAAAGAAKILNLPKEQISSALGSAGTQAAGLWEFLTDNAMSKQLHTAKAAFNGLLSALLAADGFTGARRILEGQKGFLAATAGDSDIEPCLAGLGKIFHFERNSLKQHASCGHTHSAIDAVLAATEGRPMAAGSVQSVRVKVYRAAIDLLGNVSPDSPYLAKFHLPFCIATALCYGSAGLADFTAARLKDSGLIEVMARIEISNDPELDHCYPRMWPARVEIETTAGEKLSAAVDCPRGDPENFPTDREILSKFDRLTKGLLSARNAARIKQMVGQLESIEDVATILNPAASN
jgi:2-methylcitrate dehydratase PrpD